MKQALIIYFVFIFNFESLAQQVKDVAKNPSKGWVEVPQFKDDEYAIFIDDNYKIFKTKNFEKFELIDTCFKKNKPNCLAYKFAQIKPKNLQIEHEGFDNLAAIHCEKIGGKNLIALDNKKNHYNFCKFNDGSLVNSWSMHYKHFPNLNIK